jgi:Asp-tRNA(Asn)/Glu-tRNA(Gln) amidotransferase A subunit family amidase
MNCEGRIGALLERIEAREGEIGAWAWLDRDGALRRARALDASACRGALHGMAIGVKDVIDTADMPTQYNSPIYAGHRPARDAEVVRRLKRAGAIILGKTVTTEFAFMAPGKTRNPHDLSCTPGGSSSGSAAAVAAGMVPVALTTQTGGSTIRPAAYCGVIGYKPAFNRFPTPGLKHLAPSLDTIGLHARSFDDLERVAAVLADDAGIRVPGAVWPRPRFALVRSPQAGLAEPQAIQRLQQAAQALREAGAQVRELELPVLFGELDHLHRVIMSKEVSQAFATEWGEAPDKLSADLARFIEQGLAYSDAQVAAARDRVGEGKRSMDRLLMDGEWLLALPAPGEAPVGLASTGNSIFNRIWTLLGVPCLSLPAGRGQRNLPLGVQLVARNGGQVNAESELLACARWAQDALAAAGLGP